MKRFVLLLTLCLGLLSGCADSPGDPPQPPADVTVLCRIVAADEDALLLADDDGIVYTLPAGELPWFLDGQPIDLASPGAFAALPNGTQVGALAEVTWDGAVLETWPAQLGAVSAVNLRSDGFDDRCALYLRVLEDLWEADPALSDQVTQVGVDLSKTSLSPGEQAAVTMAFGQSHRLDAFPTTWEELVEQVDLTVRPLPDDDPDPDRPAPAFYQWEDGCLLSITEQPAGEGELVFSAQKWRSSLGAYGFSSCTASRAPGGQWGDYTMGGEYCA